MKRFTLAVAVLCLAGCTPQLVVMQNPTTGELVQCRHDPWGSIVGADVRACVDGYTKAGWRDMNGGQ
jgi:hypothetical protein